MFRYYNQRNEGDSKNYTALLKRCIYDYYTSFKDQNVFLYLMGSCKEMIKVGEV